MLTVNGVRLVTSSPSRGSTMDVQSGTLAWQFILISTRPGPAKQVITSKGKILNPRYANVNVYAACGMNSHVISGLSRSKFVKESQCSCLLYCKWSSIRIIVCADRSMERSTCRICFHIYILHLDIWKHKLTVTCFFIFLLHSHSHTTYQFKLSFHIYTVQGMWMQM